MLAMTNVNWSEPIEAFHPDGRVVEVELVDTDPEDSTMTRRISPYLDREYSWFKEDGSHWDTQWRIRNRNRKPKPSPELVERMIKIIGQIDRDYYEVCEFVKEESRAILAELEPVDPDLELARDIIRQEYTGFCSSREIENLVLSAIKHVRAEKG